MKKVEKLEDLKDFGPIVTIQIEPLYKHISGYYKRLKNKRIFKNESETVDEMLYFYGASFFQENYNIEPDQISNFLFFCLEMDDDLLLQFENKNYSAVLEIFNKKALNFDKQ